MVTRESAVVEFRAFNIPIAPVPLRWVGTFDPSGDMGIPLANGRTCPRHSGMKSMTGYGRGESSAAEAKVVVELKSVNRKQSELVVMLPPLRSTSLPFPQVPKKSLPSVSIPPTCLDFGIGLGGAIPWFPPLDSQI